MANTKESKNFSSEVEEIMTDVPGWLVSHGMTITGLIFVTLLSVAWFVKYPDVIKAEVTITSSPAPIKLVSRSEGRIRIFKKEKEYAKRGSTIGYIQDDVELQDILTLEGLLRQGKYDSIRKSSFEIGEFEMHLSKLNSVTVDIQNLNQTNLFGKKIYYLQEKLRNVHILSDNISQGIELLRRELQIEKKKFERDSILFATGAISSLTYEDSKIRLIQKASALRNKKSELYNNIILVDNINSQLMDLTLDREIETNRLNSLQLNSKRELISAINQWKEKHLLISPISGKVTYLDVINDEDFITKGKDLFSVIPDAIQIYGNAYIPLYKSGKVKLNQKINIKLFSYPFEQYGVVEGNISTISTIPNNDKYLVRIELEDDLKSSYNLELDFKPELKGEAEIITEDLRLLERLYYQLIKLIRS